MAVALQRSNSLEQSNRRAATAFLLPIVIIFFILTLVPLIQSIIWSFGTFNSYTNEFKFTGLANYRDVFGDADLLAGVAFTLFYTVVTTIVITAIAIPLAVTLNRPFFGRDFSRALLFFLGVPSLAILGLVWRYIFNPLDSGVINSVLIRFGLESKQWLAEPGLAKFAIIVVGVWAAIGWHATLYLAYLQAIPGDLYEQATIDGATTMQQFRHVTLPQLVPAITVSTFLLVTFALKLYDLPYTLTKGGPGNSTYTITQSIYERGLAQSNYGVGSALAVLFTIATLVVIVGQMKVSNYMSKRYL